MAVVDLLEVIDVHEQQGQRSAGPHGPGDLRIGLPLPRGGVQQPGLGVGTGRRGQLLVHETALQQDDRRQGDQQEQEAERAGHGDQDADARLGEVEQQALPVPQHLGQRRLGVGQVRGDRDDARVEHREQDRAGDRGHNHGRPGEPVVRAVQVDPERLGDGPVEHGRRGGARQPERGRAEHPAVHGDPAGAQVEHRADAERREQYVERRQQQRDRQPPGGQQVPRHSRRLAEPTHSLDADHGGGQQRGEQRQVACTQLRVGELPADQGQVTGEDAQHVYDQ